MNSETDNFEDVGAGQVGQLDHDPSQQTDSKEEYLLLEKRHSERHHEIMPDPGPQLQLAMRRRVPDTAQSISFALKGNIAGLKYLCSQGLASPRDVSDSRGFSLMRVGIDTPFPLLSWYFGERLR